MHKRFQTDGNWGERIPDNATLEDVIALDPVDFSDRELRPLQVPAFTGPDGFRMVDVPDFRAVVRTADDKVQSIVSDGYGIIQPRAMLGSFFEIAGKADAKLKNVGFLKDSKVMFAQADIPSLNFALGADLINAALTMANSFDGSLTKQVGFAWTAPVCANTFAMALKEAKKNGKVGSTERYWQIRHTRNAADKFEGVVQALKAIRKQAEAFQATANRMADAKMSQADFADFAAVLIPNPDGEANPAKATVKREALIQAFTTAPGQNLPARAGTVWGAFNAVTFWTSNVAPVRAADPAEQARQRWFNATLGTTADLAEQAFQTLRVLAL